MGGISSASLNWSSSGMGGFTPLHYQPSRTVVVPTTITNNQENSYTSNSSTTANHITRPGDVSTIQANSSTSDKSRVNQQVDAQPQDNALSANKEAEQQQRQVEQVLAQLRSRDQEVRTHEQAHLAAAGQYASGGIKYSYQTGPDGQKYAVGGSVGIDTSPIAGDPEATAQKAMVIQRAALAPAEPSGQDMKVAAQASQMLMQAQAEVMAQRKAERKPEQQDHVNAKNVTDTDAAANKPNEPNKINPARNEFDLRLVMQNQQPDELALSA